MASRSMCPELPPDARAFLLLTTLAGTASHAVPLLPCQLREGPRMVPACKDLGVMAVCGQKVAPSTLTPCHLHDGAGAHSVCRGGTGFLVRTGSHGSHPQGSSGLAGCSALFQDNPEIAESCLCDGHSELRWVEGSVEGSPCRSGIWTPNCIS